MPLSDGRPHVSIGRLSIIEGGGASGRGEVSGGWPRGWELGKPCLLRGYRSPMSRLVVVRGRFGTAPTGRTRTRRMVGPRYPQAGALRARTEVALFAGARPQRAPALRYRQVARRSPAPRPFSSPHRTPTIRCAMVPAGGRGTEAASLVTSWYGGASVRPQLGVPEPDEWSG